MGRPCYRRRWASSEVGGGGVMAEKIEKIGSDGIHTLVKRTAPATEENVEDWLTGDSSENFWAEVERILERCDKIMRKHGWDRQGGCDFPDHHSVEPFSELWHAGRIGLDCWFLLNSVRPDNADAWFLHRIYRFGVEVADANWRLTHRPNILTGRKQRKNLTECRLRSNAASKQAAEARRDAIRIMLEVTKLTGGVLEKHLKDRLLIEMEVHVSKRTIRDDLKKIRAE